MSPSMNPNSQQEKSTVGLLLIVGDIISNEQREEICHNLQQAFKQIDNDKYHEINDLFNNLIHENEFHTDSQYRQIANTENGSTAAFLYLPNFHTLLNVLRDLFNACYHVCIIFCGQQIDSNGAFILSDSVFTCDNLHSLFEEKNTSYCIEDLQIILPFISNQWLKLSNTYLQKQLQNVQIDDLSNAINQEISFGQRFYERLIQVLNDDSVDFDIYTKLIPRDSSGTIAFDEPNLYILYGQQGEASLFGVRGFVVLVNGGFSRIPSYWNLIRGLQTIDACILTHFDYDVFPGLQTILHRKTIPSSSDNQLCKPDIGAVFLNHIQRTKIQSTSVLKSSSNRKLLVNLTENIDQFLNNIKQLNIDTFDLIKQTKSNKQSIEPINLYKKIAFGSLDLYVLHPTASVSEDDKMITALQKIPIRDQQVSSSIIPLHHWYSSCSLLVWTPSSKLSKNSLVRILYTGACPQTLVFEALSRVRHLEFLYESQQTKTRTGNIKIIPSANTNVRDKHPPQKPKVSPPISTTQNKTTKVTPRPNISKPKFPQSTTIKSEKSRSVSSVKKTPPSTANGSPRSINNDKKTQKPHGPVSKPTGKAKQVKNHVSKLKVQKDQKPKLIVENEHKEELETQNRPEEQPEIHHNHEERQEVRDDDTQNLGYENKDEQNLETEIDDEQKLEIQNNEYEQFDEIEPNFSSQNDNDEQQLSADELNETSIDNPEDEIKRPESISLTNDHNESLVESSMASPIDEIKSQLSPHDLMTTGFVDGAPNTQNPFIENTDDHEDDDDMEIIHHEIPASPKYPMPSIEDIDPQGLPIEKDVHPKKSTVKKLNNGSNRTNGLSTTANNTNHMSIRQSKPTSSSSAGSIFNVDVAYIPYHGNENYVDSEFFRRIRARYYILNAVQISRLTLESLIHGKQQWNKKEHAPVTLVPTFDGEQLRQFFVINKNRLAELNINILPASTRCNVQYDDEGSPAQLLRFTSLYDADE